MAETKTSILEEAKEAIHSHVHENSWMNIIDWENWVIGTTDDAVDAEQYHIDNEGPSPKFFFTVDAGTPDNAKALLDYFHKIGVPENENSYGGKGGPMKTVYIFKISL